MIRGLRVFLGRLTTAAMLTGAAFATCGAIAATQARASTSQISIFQDDPRLDKDPAGTLQRMRLLGAQVVRVSVPWYFIAPARNATRTASSCSANAIWRGHGCGFACGRRSRRCPARG